MKDLPASNPLPGSPARKRVVRKFLFVAVIAGVLLSVAAYVVGPGLIRHFAPTPQVRTTDVSSAPRRLVVTPRLTVWWDALPQGLGVSSQPDGTATNIHPDDYAGPDACRACHPKNHADWSAHPHRLMNALATATTIRGDFSGAEIRYLGGRATFTTADDAYVMKLERGGGARTYQVTQTIGSRFFQYYVGRQLEGPEPAGHHFYDKDHVLPFGYWLDQKEWVPLVHIGPEQPDAYRPDPFAPPASGPHYAEYAASCNYCHTTFPLGDLLGRRPHQMGQHAPARLDWSVRGYLSSARPAELPDMDRLLQGTANGPLTNPMSAWDAPHYAATLGISCEACHLGGRAHIESKGTVPPRFFPASPHVLVEATTVPGGGRTRENLNWACGRCHIGDRPTFAAGMSTWNSVEYSDAMRGSCYSQLRCIDCHNPHQATGRQWAQPPERDDAVCLKCHAKYAEAVPRKAHTHHPAGSAGDRCLNCHMPRINEGLQDVVRTHMIYSPTQADMLEANHPNACNLCHTEQPIDWTLGQLKNWYGKTYPERKIAAHYPDRAAPVALGWLASDNESVRLVAADALARGRDPAAIPHLLDALDDPFLLNRQFAVKNLQDAFDIRPADFDYRFYMTGNERRRSLAALRERFAAGTTPAPRIRPRAAHPAPSRADPR